MTDVESLDDKLRDRKENYLRDSDRSLRISLARAPQTDLETLLLLSRDKDRDVRLALARSRSSVSAVQLIMANDPDADVRLTALTALRRNCRLLDTASESDVRALFRELEQLTRHAQEETRWEVADIVATAPGAPRDLVIQLARDADTRVASLALQFAVALNDDDLLAIIAAAPPSARLTAIARRAGLSGDVCEAISATDDIDAITALLYNQSAQIREATLDSIVARAPTRLVWHGALVSHRKITGELARKLAAFVEKDLLDTLAQRTDLNAKTREYLSAAISTRRDRSQPNHMPSASAKLSQRLFEITLSRLRAEKERARISTKAIMAEAVKGLTPYVGAALALRARIGYRALVLSLRPGRSLSFATICWAADLTAAEAERLQELAGCFSPSEIIRPTALGWFRVPEATFETKIGTLRRLDDE